MLPLFVAIFNDLPIVRRWLARAPRRICRCWRGGDFGFDRMTGSRVSNLMSTIYQQVFECIWHYLATFWDLSHFSASTESKFLRKWCAFELESVSCRAILDFWHWAMGFVKSICLWAHSFRPLLVFTHIFRDHLTHTSLMMDMAWPGEYGRGISRVLQRWLLNPMASGDGHGKSWVSICCKRWNGGVHM